MEYSSSFCVFPQDTNYMKLDMIFGGKMLSEMDTAAHLAVRRLLQSHKCVGYTVTVGVNDCSFFCPAYVGDIVSVRAEVMSTTRKTFTARVWCYVESHSTGEKKQMSSGSFTFCYMESGKPIEHGITL